MTPASCLNCGADLNGAFCGACGQRSVPANPTVAELAGDAWQELSGYDGRIASTFRGSWFVTSAKAMGIGVVYLFASIPAFFLVLVWASLT